MPQQERAIATAKKDVHRVAERTTGLGRRAGPLPASRRRRPRRRLWLQIGLSAVRREALQHGAGARGAGGAAARERTCWGTTCCCWGWGGQSPVMAPGAGQDGLRRGEAQGGRHTAGETGGGRQRRGTSDAPKPRVVSWENGWGQCLARGLRCRRWPCAHTLPQRPASACSAIRTADAPSPGAPSAQLTPRRQKRF